MGNKHLSVLMLYVRSAIVPVCFVSVLLAAVQSCIFFWTMHHDAESLASSMQPSFSSAIWIAALLLLIGLLSQVSGGGYTVRRLRISEQAAFLWHSLVCFCSYLLLWMVELITTVILCRHFLLAAETISDQMLFLSFYSNDFLHSLLPLEEISRWVWLLVSFAALALATANAHVRIRYAVKPAPLILVSITILWFFQRPLGSIASDVLTVMLHLCVALYAVWDVWNNAQEVATSEDA